MIRQSKRNAVKLPVSGEYQGRVVKNPSAPTGLENGASGARGARVPGLSNAPNFKNRTFLTRYFP